jgi:hypothetical protein
LPRTEYRSPRRKTRNLILTHKGEEAHKEDNMPIGTLFLEPEEEEEVEEGEIKCFFCGKIEHKYFQMYR